MLAPDTTTEIFTETEIAYMNWRADNPELFLLIVVLFMLLVALVCLFWWLTIRERKITAMRIERERARRNREANRMNGSR